MTDETEYRPGPSDGACLDCHRKYGGRHGFPDLIVSPEVWEAINPGSNGAGLLCPSCICARAFAAGVTSRAVFTSGPFLDRRTIYTDPYELIREYEEN